MPPRPRDAAPVVGGLDPTFADALALVRREIWQHQAFSTSLDDGELVKVPRAIVACLTETLCYVA